MIWPAQCGTSNDVLEKTGTGRHGSRQGLFLTGGTSVRARGSAHFFRTALRLTGIETGGELISIAPWPGF